MVAEEERQTERERGENGTDLARNSYSMQWTMRMKACQRRVSVEDHGPER